MGFRVYLFGFKPRPSLDVARQEEQHARGVGRGDVDGLRSVTRGFFKASFKLLKGFAGCSNLYIGTDSLTSFYKGNLH